MINDTLNKIKQTIVNTRNINESKREELLSLIENLKGEIDKLSVNDAENAQTIANFTRTSTHEAVKGKRDDELVSLSINGLALSAKKFEVSHPNLVSAVNSVCTFLSNMGI